jgi:hypothetical protein
MPNLQASISEESNRMLVSFKKVVDAVLEEETDFGGYMDIVISQGVKKILNDVIAPKEIGLLWQTIELISKANPEFMSQFIVDMLKRGEEINRQGAKQRLGFIKS